MSYVRTSANYFGRGNNTSGVLLPALRTPPDFDNTQYAVNGVHRTWRFPNPGPGQERFNRVFDNPFYVLNAGVSAPAQTADPRAAARRSDVDRRHRRPAVGQPTRSALSIRQPPAESRSTMCTAVSGRPGSRDSAVPPAAGTTS